MYLYLLSGVRLNPITSKDASNKFYSSYVTPVWWREIAVATDLSFFTVCSFTVLRMSMYKYLLYATYCIFFQIFVDNYYSMTYRSSAEIYNKVK